MTLRSELLMCLATLEEALGLALSGRVSDGYAVLDLGLAAAEAPALDPITLEALPPEPWDDELVALYRKALVQYTRLFGFGPDPLPVTRHTASGIALRTCVRSQRLLISAEEAQDYSESLRWKARQVRERSRGIRMRLRASGEPPALRPPDAARRLLLPRL